METRGRDRGWIKGVYIGGGDRWWGQEGRDQGVETRGGGRGWR